MFIPLPISVDDSRKWDTVPIVNPILVAVNVVVFFLGFSGAWAVGPGTGPFSVLTYAFAHVDALHLAANMWALLVFGNPVNRRLGNGYYLLGYFGVALALGLIARLFGGNYLLGASGAIFAVMAMCFLLIPAAKVKVWYFALLPITLLLGLVWRPNHWVFWLIRWDHFVLRAWWGLLLVPLIELWGLWGSGWNWTNLAHLYGLVLGIAFVLLLPPKVSMNRRPAFDASR